MSYGPRLDEFLAERRAHGIHGEEAARMLADPQRYELPETDEDLDELMMLVVEQGAFPRRLGRVGGLYVDVTMGWRTTASAVRLLQSESTAENAPAHYCAHLSGLAINLGRIGRSAEGIALARLVLAAAETAYGQATPEWLDAGCGFVQTSLLRTDPNDPLLSETESVLDTLLRDAPPLGRKRDLARVLALAGHYFWTKGAHNDGSYEYELLQQAESNLASAADLRGGPERGRTLASLAQVRADLAREGLVAPEAVITTAREALQLVDRDDRPNQWLSARRILREFAPADAPNDSASPDEILRIRERHGDVEAQQCLFLEALDLQARRLPADARSLLEALWEPLHVPRGDNEMLHERLLKLAAHIADGGVVSCRNIDGAPSKDVLKKLRKLHGVRQLAARIHVAMHSDEPAEPGSWVTTRAPYVVGELQSQFWRDALTYAIAVVHTRQRDLPGPVTPFKFRCALLAAQGLTSLSLPFYATGALAPSVDLAQKWGEARPESGTPEIRARDRFELEGILDGCLHTAAYFDAMLGETGREWLLALGRGLSPYARSGPSSGPQLSLAHSVAFKGALTTDILLKPGPYVEDDGSRQARRQIAALEGIGESSTVDHEGPDDFVHEVRRCSWLHTREQRSGVTVAQRQLNSEARFDEKLLRTMAIQRMPLGIAAQNLHPGALAARLGERSVLVDLFLGHDRDGQSCVFVTLLAQDFAQQYVVPHPIEGMLQTADPTDPDAHLIADPLAPMVARLRYEILAPAGQRPVNRVGATALADTSASVLGDISGHLADLRSNGRNHLVFWPHGPLAFLPFHLLPIDEGVVADEWTATTIVALDALLPRDVESDEPAEISVGVVASPDGGIPFELPSEPRLWDQGVELARLIPNATLLPRGEASPSAATSLFPHCRRIHIGAHGATLGQVPSYHCLFLDHTEDGEGRLFAHDILRTDLRAVELVTLCACETALGRVDPAGNVRGLPTAFMAAGARAVIATLWPVTAESAIQFFRSLHIELGEGRSPRDAFRTAQVLTRSSYPRYADWGAFTYIGAWW